MFRAIALTAFALFTPTLSQAFCTDAGFTDLLSPADLAELESTAAATPYGTGLYWSATKDGTDLTILGTMHLPDPRHAGLLDMARPQLETTDLLLVEATLDDQAAMQAYMGRNTDLIAINSGPTLADRLDPATWDAVSEAASARGIPGFMAAKMQPWFLSMTLAIPPCAMQAMMTGDAGLDAMLMTAADTAGVPVAPLEPWQDMLALISDGTFDEQIDALRMGIMDPDVQDAMTADLIDRYFAENSAFGWHLARYSVDFLPNVDQAVFDDAMLELEATFLTARNLAWIPVIEDAAANHDSIFIGFGAAHLIGENGVLTLLEQDGWTITQR